VVGILDFPSSGIRHGASATAADLVEISRGHFTQIEVGQVMNYLKIAGHRLAIIIINLKNPKLEYHRVAI
jgi:hypothetical protein